MNVSSISFSFYRSNTLLRFKKVNRWEFLFPPCFRNFSKVSSKKRSYNRGVPIWDTTVVTDTDTLATLIRILIRNCSVFLCVSYERLHPYTAIGQCSTSSLIRNIDNCQQQLNILSGYKFSFWLAECPLVGIHSLISLCYPAGVGRLISRSRRSHSCGYIVGLRGRAPTG